MHDVPMLSICSLDNVYVTVALSIKLFFLLLYDGYGNMCITAFVLVLHINIYNDV